MTPDFSCLRCLWSCSKALSTSCHLGHLDYANGMHQRIFKNFSHPVSVGFTAYALSCHLRCSLSLGRIGLDVVGQQLRWRFDGCDLLVTAFLLAGFDKLRQAWRPVVQVHAVFQTSLDLFGRNAAIVQRFCPGRFPVLDRCRGLERLLPLPCVDPVQPVEKVVDHGDANAGADIQPWVVLRCR